MVAGKCLEANTRGGRGLLRAVNPGSAGHHEPARLPLLEVTREAPRTPPLLRDITQESVQARIRKVGFDAKRGLIDSFF